jgi:hypothetical protein
MQRTLLHSVAALVFAKVQSIVGRLPLYVSFTGRVVQSLWRCRPPQVETVATSLSLYVCTFWRIPLGNLASNLDFLLAFPEGGLLTAEERGVLRDFILEK